jgi:hypothetical protein
MLGVFYVGNICISMIFKDFMLPIATNADYRRGVSQKNHIVAQVVEISGEFTS